jgi:transposase InsO family protein
VKPATVIAWHRRGFARFWAWKPRRAGRRPLAPEVVALIVRMARENPLWSRRRIANELAKLGHDVGKDAVAKYMPRPAGRPPRPPSQTWGTFIRTHAVGTIAIDFFTVPTVTFGVLYVFFVLSLERRRVIHVNVTAHPTAEWAAQQIVEAVGPDAGLARLIRDRDKILGVAFDRCVDNLGLTQFRIAARSPWQNGFAERWVGTARREIVDHVIVLGEHHRRRILRAYVAYYNADRPHMSLGGDAPMRRDVEPTIDGPRSRDAKARRASSSLQEGRRVNGFYATTPSPLPAKLHLPTYRSLHRMRRRQRSRPSPLRCGEYGRRPERGGVGLDLSLHHHSSREHAWEIPHEGRFDSVSGCAASGHRRRSLRRHRFGPFLGRLRLRGPDAMRYGLVSAKRCRRARRCNDRR